VDYNASEIKNPVALLPYFLFSNIASQLDSINKTIKLQLLIGLYQKVDLVPSTSVWFSFLGEEYLITPNLSILELSAGVDLGGGGAKGAIAPFSLY